MNLIEILEIKYSLNEINMTGGPIQHIESNRVNSDLEAILEIM